MLQIRKRYKGLRWNTIYFATEENSESEKNSDIVEYNYMLMTKGEPVIDDDIIEFDTLITDLQKNKNDIFDNFEKNTKYEIRRAGRENIDVFCYDWTMSSEKLEKIISFYNGFVDTKEDLTFKLSAKWLEPYIDEKSFWCTVAYLDGQQLVEHIYYGDGKRVRLWYSASLFRNSDRNMRNTIGRANRFLHWQDILYFKERGFEVYDWGGYSDEGAVAGNGAFKKAFGGSSEKGICYLKAGSPLGAIALKMRRCLLYLKNIRI